MKVLGGSILLAFNRINVCEMEGSVLRQENNVKVFTVAERKFGISEL